MSNITMKYALNLLGIGEQPITTTTIWFEDNNGGLIEIEGYSLVVLDTSSVTEMQPDGVPVPIYQIGQSGDLIAKDYQGSFIQFNVFQGDDIQKYVVKVYTSENEVFGYWEIAYPAPIATATQVMVTTTGFKSITPSVVITANTVNVQA